MSALTCILIAVVTSLSFGVFFLWLAWMVVGAIDRQDEQHGEGG